jgi:hypothetical protein
MKAMCRGVGGGWKGDWRWGSGDVLLVTHGGEQVGDDERLREGSGKREEGAIGGKTLSLMPCGQKGRTDSGKTDL